MLNKVFEYIQCFIFSRHRKWNFREANLLDEGDNTTARDKQNIISTIANKLSYHWFGGVVTHDLWSNAWLSNGFARYLQYHITDKVRSIFLYNNIINVTSM